MYAVAELLVNTLELHGTTSNFRRHRTVIDVPNTHFIFPIAEDKYIIQYMHIIMLHQLIDWLHRFVGLFFCVCRWWLSSLLMQVIWWWWWWWWWWCTDNLGPVIHIYLTHLFSHWQLQRRVTLFLCAVYKLACLLTYLLIYVHLSLSSIIWQYAGLAESCGSLYLRADCL